MNYIGSKLSLLSFIEENIKKHVNTDVYSFLDLFGGTNVVSSHFKKLGLDVMANDIQYFSYVNAKAIIENNLDYTFSRLKEINIDDPFTYLNNLKGRKGFIYKNYSFEGTKDKEYQRMYFSDENSKKIDAIRLKIKLWKNKGYIQEREYFYLLACLIEAADKVANTASVYEAFLKQLKPSASKELTLIPLNYDVIEGNHMYLAFNEDAEELLSHVKGDILYLDPPYNSRKYDTNYHILETIALYDNPKIKGKTGMRDENSKRSLFCIKNKAAGYLESLIKRANFKYIFLSYNDEGIIPLEEIERIFSKYGAYSKEEIDYRRFKADSNREYKKAKTIEYLHCLVKDQI